METVVTTSETISTRRFAGLFLLVAGAWAILLFRGYPFPYVDDLYHIGAGVNLGMGGKLLNPMIENLGPFYAYPPIHSYVIASWLWAFGVGAKSMVALYGFLGFSSTLLVIRSFQILKRSFLGYLTAIAVVLYLAATGMRPDASGLFFIAVSLRLGVSSSDIFRRAAPFFAFLAVSALPATLALAIPWICFLVYKERGMWKWAILGAGMAGCLFIILVSGNIIGFLHGFFANNSAAGNIQMGWVRSSWYKPMGIIKIVYPTVMVFALAYISIRRRGAALLDTLAILSVLLGLYAIKNSTSGHRVMGLISIIAISFYIYELFPKHKLAKWLVLCNALIVILSGLRPIMQGLTEYRPTNGPQLLAQVNRVSPSRIIVDEWTFRYVFDCRITPCMIAVGYADRVGCTPGVISLKYPDECWVLSSQSVENYRLDPHGLPTPRPVTIRGVRIGRWSANAGELGVSLPGE